MELFAWGTVKLHSKSFEQGEKGRNFDVAATEGAIF